MQAVVNRQGNVVLNNVMFQCTDCGKWKAGYAFGLRKMKDGKIRNQAQCKVCRSKYHKDG